MGKYDDIINIPYIKSKRHANMTVEERAAMFAPFAALTGHSESILETERITKEKIIIDEDKKSHLDNLINNLLMNQNSASITYFIKDKNKSGGRYVTVSGLIKKIDTYNHTIILTNNVVIPICDVFDIKKH